MKAKLIHLEDHVFKIMAKHAIDRNTDLKKLIQSILEDYAYSINKGLGSEQVAVNKTSKKDEEPIPVSKQQRVVDTKQHF
jgi:hypothetical protein